MLCRYYVLLHSPFSTRTKLMFSLGVLFSRFHCFSTTCLVLNVSFYDYKLCKKFIDIFIILRNVGIICSSSGGNGSRRLAVVGGIRHIYFYWGFMSNNFHEKLFFSHSLSLALSLCEGAVIMAKWHTC